MRHLAWLAPLFALACDTSPNGGSHGDGGMGAPDAMWSPQCIEAQEHCDFDWIQENIFTRSCANFSSCHQGPNPPAQLNLTAGMACADLVNVDATGRPGWKRVTPGDPDRSHLMYKLGALGPIDPDAGTIMPPGQPMCSPKVQSVRCWIEMGATCP